MIEIVLLESLSERQVEEVRGLMHELNAGIEVSGEMVRATVEAPGTRFFAAMEDGDRIVGCASLCVFMSPTGLKGSVEDVVVGEAYRGRHLGRRLLEAVIGYARVELRNIDLHLTSRPQRVAANQLYQSLGFERRETNCYRLVLRSE